jgi:hypothetical protein
MIRTSFLLGGIALSAVASAHHSTNLYFDRDNVVEIAGTLTRVEWRNPHSLLIVETIGEDGRETLWQVESRAATQLIRAGLTPDAFQIGDSTRIAGFRGLRNSTSIFLTNILLTDGRELVVDHFAEPRWSANLVGSTTGFYQAARVEDLPTTSAGLFRVWGSDAADRGGDNEARTLWNDSYPLTRDARTAQANWDPVAENPYVHCRSGMPAIMDQPYPLEFVSEGDDILLFLEEQDTVRRIHIANEANADSEPDNPFGYSTGRWEDDTLVVTTINIDWPWFDQTGIPQTDALKLVERFTPSVDGSVLRYQVTATDPAIFTEPVILERRWIWVEGEERIPYNCISDSRGP